MGRVASEIAGGKQPTGSDLALQAEIPLSYCWVLRIELHNRVGRIQREWRVRTSRRREWVSARISCPRVVEARIVDRDSRSQRWRDIRCLMEADRNDVVEGSERGANRCLAVAVYIPCEPDAR